MKRTALKRRTRIRRVNRERRKSRYERAFGEKGEWVRLLRCLVCGDHEVEAHHVKTRGAGGTSEHLVPFCTAHHRQYHDQGRETFEATHDIDLTLEALDLESQWQHFKQTGDLEF